MTVPLTRLTVNLTPKSVAALRNVNQLTEDTKTESVNRAIQIYDMLCQAQAAGDKLAIRGAADGKLRTIKLI
jgi:hypothetical protein